MMVTKIASLLKGVNFFNPYVWLGFLIWSLAISGGSFFYGKHIESVSNKKDMLEKQVKIDKQILQLQTDLKEAREKKQDKIEDKSKEYQDEIRRIENDFNAYRLKHPNGLRVQSCRSNSRASLPGTAPNPTGSNAETGKGAERGGSGEVDFNEVEDEIRRIGFDLDRRTAQLEKLQEACSVAVQ